MLNALRKFSPFTLFFLIVLLIALKIPQLIAPPAVTVSDYEWGWKWLYQMLVNIFGNHPRNFVVLGMLNTFLQAIFVNRLTTQFGLFKKDSFLPAGMFILIASLMPEWAVLSAPSLVAWIIIYLLFQSMQLPNAAMPNKLLFNQGLSVGLSTIIYYPSILLLLFVWWTLAIIQRGKFKNFVLPLIGVIIVPYLIISIQYITDIPILKLNYSSTLQFNMPARPLSITFIIASTVLALILALSIFYINRIFDKEVIITKNRWNMVIIMMIVCIILSSFRVGNESAFWYIAIIPIALMGSSILAVSTNKWVLHISYYLLLGIVLFLQYQRFIL